MMQNLSQNLSNDEWKKGLKTLKELYAVGLNILCDSQHPYLSEQNHWDKLNRLWNEFQALDPYLKSGLAPEEPQLREELNHHLLATQDLLKALSSHCTQVQSQIGNLLLRSHSWASQKDLTNPMEHNHNLLGKV